MTLTPREVRALMEDDFKKWPKEAKKILKNRKS